VGGWILAALLLVGYNGFNFMLLLDPILPRRSNAAMLASQKWQEFQKKQSKAVKTVLDNIDLDLILSRTKPYSGEDTKAAEIPKEKEEKEGGKKEVTLPKLTGILQVSNVNGTISSLAVIEGKTLHEQDKVLDFTIEKITNKGVIITKGGKKWFIPTPKVHFSLDHGG